MSSYLVFTNLRPDLTLVELDEILDQTGPSDRTSVELVQEEDSVVAMIGVPWESPVAAAVAQKINGLFVKGRTLSVHATSLFSP